MQLTFIGAIEIAIGLAILLAGSLRSAFVMLVISGLFGGSAAILLPALGGSSIPPMQVALLFVLLRMLAPSAGYLNVIPEAIRANLWLVVYVVYGVVLAYLGPRIFAGSMQVAPLQPLPSADLFATTLLGPSSQNFTSAFYLLGTLLAACSSFVFNRYCRGGTETLISAAIAVGWLHVILGLAVLAAHGTPLHAFFDLFRNGNYAQLNQSYQGFVRMRGLMPEASAYAGFGFTWFVLNAELWYRSIRPQATGPVALMLATALFFSTSSTAYVGLAGYFVWFVGRAIVLPGTANAIRLVQFGAATLGIAVMLAILLLSIPALPLQFLDVVRSMTVDKPGSESAQQRLFWAVQGWDAFKASYGVGIGPGSFRSSSFLTAVLGATGIVGTVSMMLYFFRVFQPLRRSTYGGVRLAELSVGGAFAASALLMQIPNSVSAPKPDPGVAFALFSGAAIALRPRKRRTDDGPLEDTEASIEAPRLTHESRAIRTH
ncbi:glycoside hydrolase [Tsuneonella mangrovi]|uniref:glycoside hydrolase n=1 Tax=Tsuneonella mangrovi TaxID=1982042 RepID=UPI000BA29F52|nr:glycoside hydrolase [Tsuneonella mangrovi]